MARIYIIIGKSATGKDTIYKMLLESEKLSLKKVVMYTTRPIRNGETDGIEYHFVDEKHLYELKEQNKIIEHRSYDTMHGKWHYFTVNDGQIDIENNDYLIIGTLEAYSQFIKCFGSDRVIPIYIEVEDEIRLLRAIMREKKQEQPRYAETCRRYLADEEDFSEEKLQKHGIIKKYNNIELMTCLSQIETDIKKSYKPTK